MTIENYYTFFATQILNFFAPHLIKNMSVFKSEINPLCRSKSLDCVIYNVFFSFKNTEDSGARICIFNIGFVNPNFSHKGCTDLIVQKSATSVQGVFSILLGLLFTVLQYGQSLSLNPLSNLSHIFTWVMPGI